MDNLGSPILRPVDLLGDNQGANALSKNNQFHSRTKHIELRHRFVTQLFDDNVLSVSYLPTKDMLADGLTKPLPEEEHRRHHFSLMGMIFPPITTKEKKGGFPSTKLQCGCGNLFKTNICGRRHSVMH